MTVDVHGHVTSPELLERLPMPPSLGDVAGMIEQKAAAGITTTIVGSPVGAGTMVVRPGPDNYAQPADGLERFHDWVAETVRAHPGALRGYVYLNPLGGDDAVARAARRIEQEEFVGFIVNTSIRGEHLDSDRAEAFFTMAAERRAPVLLHPPAEPVGGGGLAHAGLVEHVARPCDVTIGTAAIVMAGWPQRLPDLVLIVSNSGAGLPLLVEKLDLAARRGAAPGPPPSETARSPGESLRRLYADTATPSPVALGAALATWGPDRLLFGTDSPPLTEPPSAAVRRVTEMGLSGSQQRRVLGDTARELFGLAPSPRAERPAPVDA